LTVSEKVVIPVPIFIRINSNRIPMSFDPFRTGIGVPAPTDELDNHRLCLLALEKGIVIPIKV